MVKYLVKNYLPLLVLFFFFFDELFHTLLLVNGRTEFTGIKQYGAILLAVMVYPMMAYHFIKGKIDKRTHRVLLFCGIVLILYLLTSALWGGTPDKYIVFLLVYGSESLPAAYIGALIAKSANRDKIFFWLPFFIIPTSLILGTVGYTVAIAGEMVSAQDEDSGGLNYQRLSYFMAFSFTYTLYYIYYCGLNKTFNRKLQKYLFILLLVFTSLICLVSGGRGGFLVLVAVSSFVMLYYMKRSRISILKLTFFLFIIACLIISIVIYFDAMETRGVMRLTTRIFDASSREGLYKNSINAFLSAPWGNGLGSIFWINGIYSHNMIIDFLAELGIIGTIFMVVIIFKAFLKLYKYSNTDSLVLFMLLAFIANTIHYMFSGYWMGAHKLFLICAFIYCYKPPVHLSVKKEMSTTHKR